MMMANGAYQADSTASARRPAKMCQDRKEAAPGSYPTR